MEFKQCFKDLKSGDWVCEFEMTEEEHKIIAAVEEENHMTIQEITRSWLLWMIKNPVEGGELLKKWSREQISAQ